MEQRNRAARRQAKRTTAANARLTCPTIAKQVVRDNYTPEDHFFVQEHAHTERQLAQQVSYHKKKGHMTNPPRGNLWFDLKDHMLAPLYDDLFRRDISNEGARLIVMANNDMIQRLKEAHTWYFDSTFKVCPNDHFKQLGTVHCIINNQIQKTSQSIACAFILMSRRRASDYEHVFQALIELVAPDGQHYNLASHARFRGCIMGSSQKYGAKWRNRPSSSDIRLPFSFYSMHCEKDEENWWWANA